MTSSEAHDLFQTADRWLKEREQGSHYLDTSRLETDQAKKTEKNANNFFFRKFSLKTFLLFRKFTINIVESGTCPVIPKTVVFKFLSWPDK
jgi:hypothetical protein